MADFNVSFSFFFFNHPAPTEIYTLSLHDALPISFRTDRPPGKRRRPARFGDILVVTEPIGPCDVSNRRHFCPARSVHLTRPRRFPAPSLSSDRKSTRLNSSHRCISYAVFCLKKKK